MYARLALEAISYHEDIVFWDCNMHVLRYRIIFTQDPALISGRIHSDNTTVYNSVAACIRFSVCVVNQLQVPIFTTVLSWGRNISLDPTSDYSLVIKANDYNYETSNIRNSN